MPPTPLSCYVLTCNSERRLGQVLSSLVGIADDLVVVDSGSADHTEEIARQFGARFVFHEFENFTAQRQFAIEQCQHLWILVLDSDEVLSPALIQRIGELKAAGFVLPNNQRPDIFGIHRDWFLLGRKIHCFYPSRCPDSPLRLFRRDKVGFIPGRHVHEGMTGFSQCAGIKEPIYHYTCDSIDDMYAKINQYSTLSAKDLRASGKRSGYMKILALPWLIWARWYLLYGGWKDRGIGLVHGRYVRDMIYQKYIKLKYDSE